MVRLLNFDPRQNSLNMVVERKYVLWDFSGSAASELRAVVSVDTTVMRSAAHCYQINLFHNVLFVQTCLSKSLTDTSIVECQFASLSLAVEKWMRYKNPGIACETKLPVLQCPHQLPLLSPFSYHSASRNAHKNSEHFSPAHQLNWVQQRCCCSQRPVIGDIERLLAHDFS